MEECVTNGTITIHYDHVRVKRFVHVPNEIANAVVLSPCRNVGGVTLYAVSLVNVTA